MGKMARILSRNPFAPYREPFGHPVHEDMLRPILEVRISAYWAGHENADPGDYVGTAVYVRAHHFTSLAGYQGLRWFRHRIFHGQNESRQPSDESVVQAKNYAMRLVDACNYAYEKNGILVTTVFGGWL